jgi:hypothetical protein
MLLVFYVHLVLITFWVHCSMQTPWSNVICIIIFYDSFSQNKALVRNVTNFLWSQCINDVTQHLCVLEINNKIVNNCKECPTN